jgi:hypothetical protein
MDLMNNNFMEYLDKFIMESTNDILVWTKDKGEHEEHLCLVLQKLQDHRPHVKLSKCEFWMKKVSFLSHVISEEGMPVESSQIWHTLSWNAPASVADVHSFLGLVGYY